VTRFRASFYNLLISLVAFFFLAYPVLFVWYPDFFYTIDGGWEGMRIIVGVNLVLGPLLTLVIYKAGKPGLKFDLATIGCLQAVCLAAGVYVVYAERPLFFIYYDKHFYSASADTYLRYKQTPPDAYAYSSTTPAIVVSTVPDDPIEEADFRKILYQDELPVWVYETSYRPLADNMDTVLQNAYPIEKLRERDTGDMLDKWLKKHGGTADDYAFFPIHSRYRDPFVAINREHKTFIDIIEIAAPPAN
jgi:hypothetical protein